MLGVSSETLDDLRARIATIEKRPALAGFPVSTPDREGLSLAAPGQLHEIFAAARRDAGSALGFALGMARGLLTAKRPALLIVQMKNESADMGVPYGAGLKSFGIDPNGVVLARAETITEFLWAIEEAISCEAVAAVIADVGRPHRELDFTASRRLNLRVGSGGSAVFLLRYGQEREATAANLRWRLEPASSGETMFDARAPTGPRFLAVLEKGRLAGDRHSAGTGMLLDWTKDGFVVVGDSMDRRASGTSAAALPRALPAAMGDRLSKAG